MQGAALAVLAVVVLSVAFLLFASARRAWNAGGEDDRRRVAASVPPVPADATAADPLGASDEDGDAAGQGAGGRP